jgi:hypothetical protein
VKYRYYIISEDGELTGTNDLGLAERFNEETDCIVLDCEEGRTLSVFGVRPWIAEASADELLEDDDAG